jgi:hypothetical protein
MFGEKGAEATVKEDIAAPRLPVLKLVSRTFVSLHLRGRSGSSCRVNEEKKDATEPSHEVRGRDGGEDGGGANGEGGRSTPFPFGTISSRK